jgi:hypothetical protein
MSKNPAIEAWIKRLKETDLLELADRLNLKRAKGKNSNFKSPHHDDKSASLSIDRNKGWKDWSTDQSGGAIDLVMYVLGCEFMDACNIIGGWFGLPKPPPEAKAPVKKTTAEYIADNCFADTKPVVQYLSGRCIADNVINAALKKRSVGFNAYKSKNVSEGQAGHGGPAAAFIVRHPVTGQVVAVDLRYLSPELNGNVKTQCQGEKYGYYWTSDPARLRQAQTVYIVESPVNALSVETAIHNEKTAALAIRGTANVTNIDWTFLRGKRVLIALDHTDKINEQTGKRPGLAAAWQLSEILTAHDISSMFVDMQDWDEGEDINDLLQREDEQETARLLRKLEGWIIPGMPGGGERTKGCGRIWLPSHDYAEYWRFRATEDFTRYVSEWKDVTDDAGETNRKEDLSDLCSFRVAGISRLQVQGHLATINGTPDNVPDVVFGVSCQTARHGAILQRKVVRDDKLFNVEWWKTAFGAIWNPGRFSRMINILERSAGLGARNVANFIGVAWKDGSLAVLEGQDCFFVEPEKQCLYHNLIFPRGTRQQARKVIEAYQTTFADNVAAIPLVWALGGHLKVILGFWPHFSMQADKGAGKSKLLERMQATLGFQMLSGQMLKTDHRRRASASYTTHPVGWDEFSKLPKAVLSDIDALLQSTYRFEFTRIGAALTPFLLCAPVLLAGEEVDVESLQSKICRSSLTVARQGPLLPHDLPQFPVYDWLQFIVSHDPHKISEDHTEWQKYCKTCARTAEGDATASRMIENYAAILLTWAMLCRFSGIGEEEAMRGQFIDDCIAEMNKHLADTDGTRLPWVWIMEILLSEIDAKRYEHPYGWERVDNEWMLWIRPSHVMDHISTAPHLKTKFDALPVKTGRIFKRQLLASGAVPKDMEDRERTLDGKRTAHLTGISLTKLEALGLYATPDEERKRAA